MDTQAIVFNENKLPAELARQVLLLSSDHNNNSSQCLTLVKAIKKAPIRISESKCQDAQAKKTTNASNKKMAISHAPFSDRGR